MAKQRMAFSLSRIAVLFLFAAVLQLFSASAFAQTAPIRITTRGTAYTDSLGRSWSADTYYSGGSKYSSAASVLNTTDPLLYQSERWGRFSYNVPVASGTYLVTLHFAEIYFKSAGMRVFDVLAENALKLDNLDIVAKVGAQTAYRYSFTIPVTDGTLNLGFVPVKDNAKISAIEVEPAELVVSPTGLNFGSVTVGQSSAPSNVQLINKGSSAVTINSIGLFGTAATSFKAGGTFPMSVAAGQTTTVPVTFTPQGQGALSATLEIVPAAPLQSKSVALSGTGAVPTTTPAGVTLINSGGTSLTDNLGQVWSADKNYSGGSTYATSSTITGTTNQSLYRTERYGNFSYNVPVANGTYDVTLHFAEIYFRTAGARVFDVQAENNTVISNFDIIAAAGPLAAYTKKVTVAVSDGTLNLAFIRKVDNPKLSGIELRPSTTTTPPPPTTTPPPPTSSSACPTAASPNPAVIFCDDFESTEPLTSRYWEYDTDQGDFVRAPGVGVNGSAGMRVIYQAGEVDAGNFKRSFGRTPAWLRSQSHSTQNFREVYWRIYMKNAAGWTGYPYKLSRATIFGSDTSWAQAMIAHLWSSSSAPVMLLDPATGIDANSNMITTRYNDFANLKWLGAQPGTTQVFAPENADKWYCIEGHVKLNTPGASDGVFEMWVNNNLETSKKTLNWVGSWQK